jgi:hypothetical protein
MLLSFCTCPYRCFSFLSGHGGLSISVVLNRTNEVFHDNVIELPRGRSFSVRYKLANLRPCIKALSKADMTNVRINDNGTEAAPLRQRTAERISRST